jgi:hypothetical protein
MDKIEFTMATLNDNREKVIDIIKNNQDIFADFFKSENWLNDVENEYSAFNIRLFFLGDSLIDCDIFDAHRKLVSDNVYIENNGWSQLLLDYDPYGTFSKDFRTWLEQE